MTIARIDYPDDCRRLQEVLLQEGWEVALADVQEFWGWYSAEAFQAAWMSFDHETVAEMAPTPQDGDQDHADRLATIFDRWLVQHRVPIRRPDLY